MSREPERTCIGCRSKRTKDELLRLVRSGAGVIHDPQAAEAGRGAYLCRESAAECLALAQRRQGIARSLRLSHGSIDYSKLIEEIGSSPPQPRN